MPEIGRSYSLRARDSAHRDRRGFAGGRGIDMSEAAAAAAAATAGAGSTTGTGTQPGSTTGTGAQPGSTGNQPGAVNQPAGGSQTFTQEDVNRMLAKERRDTESRFADAVAKAARLDELEEAQKSELQKANDDRDKWKAQAEALKAEKDRAEAVAKAAAEFGVDPEMLARMTGDVEENAQFLKGRADAAPKYPSITDNGNQGNVPLSKESILQLKGADRVRAMAMHPELFRNSK